MGQQAGATNGIYFGKSRFLLKVRRTFSGSRRVQRSVPRKRYGVPLQYCVGLVAELGLAELVVDPLLGHKLAVAAAFGDLTILQSHN